MAVDLDDLGNMDVGVGHHGHGPAPVVSVAVEPELMRRDVHPADVALADGRLLRDVRVFISDRRMVAYAMLDGQIARACELDLAQPCSVPASRATLGQGRLEVHLADGTVAWVNRARGCGCGSPLKALAAPLPWTAG